MYRARSRTGIFILAAVAACVSSATTAAATANTDEAYTRPQRLVTIEQGRRLNLYCIGRGSPTVVFESGLAEPTSSWFRVQPVIAKRTRACTYDRAGTGFSDPARRASTSENIVDDLHRLLRKAGVRAPYVVVGQSYGGMNARLYAYRHPDEVVGMVLVDPSHEDQSEGYRRLSLRRPTPEQWRAMSAPGLETRRRCIEAAKAGLVPGAAVYKECIFEPDVHFSEPLKAAYLAMQLRPSFHATQLSEDENIFEASAQQLRAARHDLGDLPLRVLTQAPSPKPLRSWETPELRKAREQMWLDLHMEIAASSTRGSQHVVAEAGHNIQLEQPQAVVDAIDEVLEMAGSHKVVKDARAVAR